MNAAPPGFGLPEWIAGAIALALNAYALTGGADFGGGVWHLFARGARRARQRALISSAIGPIWEANHVWLIVVIVVLFTAFPPAFATLGIVLHIPLTLVLVGIVMRGSAFVFRNYGVRTSEAQRRWGRVFAVASTMTPVFLGIVVGAIASGAVGRAGERLGAGTFREVFVAPWLSPFPVSVGLMALALFAFLAAVYLTAAATDAALREDFRRRALAAAAAVFVTAFASLLLAPEAVTHLRAQLTGTRWALPLHLATAATAIAAIGSLWRRRWKLARAAAGAQVSLILWGWVLAQFPYLVPPALAIRDAAAPRATLELVLWTLAGGALVLIPSLLYLFRTFAASASGCSRGSGSEEVHPGCLDESH